MVFCNIFSLLDTGVSQTKIWTECRLWILTSGNSLKTLMTETEKHRRTLPSSLIKYNHTARIEHKQQNKPLADLFIDPYAAYSYQTCYRSTSNSSNCDRIENK